MTKVCVLGLTADTEPGPACLRRLFSLFAALQFLARNGEVGGVSGQCWVRAGKQKLYQSTIINVDPYVKRTSTCSDKDTKYKIHQAN